MTNTDQPLPDALEAETAANFKSFFDAKLATTNIDDLAGFSMFEFDTQPNSYDPGDFDEGPNYEIIGPEIVLSVNSPDLPPAGIEPMAIAEDLPTAAPIKVSMCDHLYASSNKPKVETSLLERQKSEDMATMEKFFEELPDPVPDDGYTKVASRAERRQLAHVSNVMSANRYIMTEEETMQQLRENSQKADTRVTENSTSYELRLAALVARRELEQYVAMVTQKEKHYPVRSHDQYGQTCFKSGPLPPAQLQGERKKTDNLKVSQQKSKKTSKVVKKASNHCATKFSTTSSDSSISHESSSSDKDSGNQRQSSGLFNLLDESIPRNLASLRKLGCTSFESSPVPSSSSSEESSGSNCSRKHERRNKRREEKLIKQKREKIPKQIPEALVPLIANAANKLLEISLAKENDLTDLKSSQLFETFKSHADETEQTTAQNATAKLQLEIDRIFSKSISSVSASRSSKQPTGSKQSNGHDRQSNSKSASLSSNSDNYSSSCDDNTDQSYSDYEATTSDYGSSTNSSSTSDDDILSKFEEQAFHNLNLKTSRSAPSNFEFEGKNNLNIIELTVPFLSLLVKTWLHAWASEYSPNGKPDAKLSTTELYELLDEVYNSTNTLPIGPTCTKYLLCNVSPKTEQQQLLLSHWDDAQILQRIKTFGDSLTADNYSRVMEYCCLGHLNPDVKFRLKNEQLNGQMSSPYLSPDGILYIIGNLAYWKDFYMKNGQATLPPDFENYVNELSVSNSVTNLNLLLIPVIVVYDITTSVAKRVHAAQDSHKINKLMDRNSKYFALKEDIQNQTGVLCILGYDVITVRGTDKLERAAYKKGRQIDRLPLKGFLTKEVLTCLNSVSNVASGKDGFYKALSARLGSYYCNFQGCGKLLNDKDDAIAMLRCGQHIKFKPWGTQDLTHMHFYERTLQASSSTTPFASNLIKLAANGSLDRWLLKRSKYPSTLLPNYNKETLPILKKGFEAIRKLTEASVSTSSGIQVSSGSLVSTVLISDNKEQLIVGNGQDDLTILSENKDDLIFNYYKFKVPLQNAELSAVQLAFLLCPHFSPEESKQKTEKFKRNSRNKNLVALPQECSSVDKLTRSLINSVGAVFSTTLQQQTAFTITNDDNVAYYPSAEGVTRIISSKPNKAYHPQPAEPITIEPSSNNTFVEYVPKHLRNLQATSHLPSYSRTQFNPAASEFVPRMTTGNPKKSYADSLLVEEKPAVLPKRDIKETISWSNWKTYCIAKMGKLPSSNLVPVFLRANMAIILALEMEKNVVVLTPAVTCFDDMIMLQTSLCFNVVATWLLSNDTFLKATKLSYFKAKELLFKNGVIQLNFPAEIKALLMKELMSTENKDNTIALLREDPTFISWVKSSFIQVPQNYMGRTMQQKVTKLREKLETYNAKNSENCTISSYINEVLSIDANERKQKAHKPDNFPDADGSFQSTNNIKRPAMKQMSAELRTFNKTLNINLALCVTEGFTDALVGLNNWVSVHMPGELKPLTDEQIPTKSDSYLIRKIANLLIRGKLNEKTKDKYTRMLTELEARGLNFKEVFLADYEDMLNPDLENQINLDSLLKRAELNNLLEDTLDFNEADEYELSKLSNTLINVYPNLSPGKFILSKEDYLCLGLSHSSETLAIVDPVKGTHYYPPVEAYGNSQFSNSRFEAINYLGAKYDRSVASDFKSEFLNGKSFNGRFELNGPVEPLTKEFEAIELVSKLNAGVTNGSSEYAKSLLDASEQLIESQTNIPEYLLNLKSIVAQSCSLNLKQSESESIARQIAYTTNSINRIKKQQLSPSNSPSFSTLTEKLKNQGTTLAYLTKEINRMETLLKLSMSKAIKLIPFLVLLLLANLTSGSDPILKQFLKLSVTQICFRGLKDGLKSLTNTRHRLFTQMTVLRDLPCSDNTKSPNPKDLSISGLLTYAMLTSQLVLDSWFQLVLMTPDFLPHIEAKLYQFVLPFGSSFPKLYDEFSLDYLPNTQLAKPSKSKPIPSLSLTKLGSFEAYTMYQGVYGSMRRLKKPEELLKASSILVDDNDFDADYDTVAGKEIKGSKFLLTHLAESIASHKQIVPPISAMSKLGYESLSLVKRERVTCNLTITVGCKPLAFYLFPQKQVDMIKRFFSSNLDANRRVVEYPVPKGHIELVSAFCNTFAASRIMQENPVVIDIFSTSQFNFKVLYDTIKDQKILLKGLMLFPQYLKDQGIDIDDYLKCSKLFVDESTRKASLPELRKPRWLNKSAIYSKYTSWDALLMYVNYCGATELLTTGRGFLAYLLTLSEFKTMQSTLNLLERISESSGLTIKQLGILSFLYFTEGRGGCSFVPTVQLEIVDLNLKEKYKTIEKQLYKTVQRMNQMCLLFLPEFVPLHSALNRKKFKPGETNLIFSPESMTNMEFMNLYGCTVGMQANNADWLNMAESFSGGIYNFLFVKSELKLREITAANGILRFPISTLDSLFELFSRGIIQDLSYKLDLKYNFIQHFFDMMYEDMSLAFNNCALSSLKASPLSSKGLWNLQTNLLSEVGTAWLDNYRNKFNSVELIHSSQTYLDSHKVLDLLPCHTETKEFYYNLLPMDLILHAKSKFFCSHWLRPPYNINLNQLQFSDNYGAKVFRNSSSTDKIIGKKNLDPELSNRIQEGMLSNNIFWVDLTQMEPKTPIFDQLYVVPKLNAEEIPLLNCDGPLKQFTSFLLHSTDTYGLYSNCLNAFTITKFNKDTRTDVPLLVTDNRLQLAFSTLRSSVAQSLEKTVYSNGTVVEKTSRVCNILKRFSTMLGKNCPLEIFLLTNIHNEDSICQISNQMDLSYYINFLKAIKPHGQFEMFKLEQINTSLFAFKDSLIATLDVHNRNSRDDSETTLSIFSYFVYLAPIEHYAYSFTSDFTRFNLTMTPLLMTLLRFCAPTPDSRALLEIILDMWRKKVYQIPEYFSLMKNGRDSLDNALGELGPTVKISDIHGFNTLETSLNREPRLTEKQSGTFFVPNIMSQGMFGSMASSTTALIMKLASQFILRMPLELIKEANISYQEMVSLWDFGSMCVISGNTSDDGAGYFQFASQLMTFNGPNRLKGAWSIFAKIINSFGLTFSLSKCLIFPQVNLMELNSKIAVFDAKENQPRMVFNANQVALSQGGTASSIAALLHISQSKAFSILSITGNPKTAFKISKIDNKAYLQSMLGTVDNPELPRLLRFFDLRTWTQTEWISFVLGYPQYKLKQMFGAITSKGDQAEVAIFFFLFVDSNGSLNSSQFCPSEKQRSGGANRRSREATANELLRRLLSVTSKNDSSVATLNLNMLTGQLSDKPEEMKNFLAKNFVTIGHIIKNNKFKMGTKIISAKLMETIASDYFENNVSKLREEINRLSENEASTLLIKQINTGDLPGYSKALSAAISPLQGKYHMLESGLTLVIIKLAQSFPATDSLVYGTFKNNCNNFIIQLLSQQQTEMIMLAISVLNDHFGTTVDNLADMLFLLMTRPTASLIETTQMDDSCFTTINDKPTKLYLKNYYNKLTGKQDNVEYSQEFYVSLNSLLKAFLSFKIHLIALVQFNVRVQHYQGIKGLQDPTQLAFKDRAKCLSLKPKLSHLVDTQSLSPIIPTDLELASNGHLLCKSLFLKSNLAYQLTSYMVKEGVECSTFPDGAPNLQGKSPTSEQQMKTNKSYQKGYSGSFTTFGYSRKLDITMWAEGSVNSLTYFRFSTSYSHLELSNILSLVFEDMAHILKGLSIGVLNTERSCISMQKAIETQVSIHASSLLQKQQLIDTLMVAYSDNQRKFWQCVNTSIPGWHEMIPIGNRVFFFHKFLEIKLIPKRAIYFPASGLTLLTSVSCSALNPLLVANNVPQFNISEAIESLMSTCAIPKFTDLQLFYLNNPSALLKEVGEQANSIYDRNLSKEQESQFVHFKDLATKVNFPRSLNLTVVNTQPTIVPTNVLCKEIFSELIVFTSGFSNLAATRRMFETKYQLKEPENFNKKPLSQHPLLVIWSESNENTYETSLLHLSEIEPVIHRLEHGYVNNVSSLPTMMVPLSTLKLYKEVLETSKKENELYSLLKY